MKVRMPAAAIAVYASLLALGGAQPASGAAPDWRSCPGWDMQPSSQTLRETVFATYCIVNLVRWQHRLPRLGWNWRLWSAAQQMAGDMVERGFFAHTERGGRGLRARIAATGYLPRGDDWSLGENLGWGHGTLATPAAIVGGWMASRGHRDNLLAADYREIGLACVPGSPFATRPGGAVFVADFGHANAPRKGTKLQRRR